MRMDWMCDACAFQVASDEEVLLVTGVGRSLCPCVRAWLRRLVGNLTKESESITV